MTQTDFAPTFMHADDDAAEEAALFGAGPADDPDEPPAVLPQSPAAGKRPGRPGPAPNPNSKRQQKLAAAARRSRTAPGPAKKTTPNKPAAPADVTAVYQRGAQTILGWVMQPLAAAGIGLGVAAQMPRTPPAKKRQLALHGQALTLDMLTIQMHAEALTDAAAAAAPNVPWMARALTSAAKVGPYAELSTIGIGIVLQVLTNHGMLPPIPALGTMGPEELAAAAGVPMDEGAPAAG